MKQSPIHKRLFSHVVAALLLLTATHSYALKIGEKAPAIHLTDQHYKSTTLEELAKPNAWVLIFLSNTCPLAQRYTSRIKALEEQYRSQVVQFIGINASPADTIVDVAWYQQEHKLPFPLLSDKDGSVCKSLGVTRTPEALILDQNNVLRYRGRIDDQYRLGGVKPFIGRKDLVEALDDVLAGKEVRVPKTKAEGCSITYPALPKTEETLTYYEHVQPIIAEHCLDCHSGCDQTLPQLSKYTKVKQYSDRIQQVLVTGQMPPWPLHSEFGDFLHTRKLPWKAKNTLLQWLNGEMLDGKWTRAERPIKAQSSLLDEYQCVKYKTALAGWATDSPTVLIGFRFIPGDVVLECQLIRDGRVNEILFSIPAPLSATFTPHSLQFRSPPALQPGDSIRIVTDNPKMMLSMQACFDKP